MRYLKQSIKLVILATLGILFVIPAVYSQNSSEFRNKVEESTVASFHVKIKKLTNRLLSKLSIRASSSKIMLTSLVYEKTGELIKFKYKGKSKDEYMERIIVEQINSHDYFSIEKISEQGLKNRPAYFMRGLIELEDDNYRIYYAMFDIEGTFFGREELLISKKSGKLEQYGIYEVRENYTQENSEAKKGIPANFGFKEEIFVKHDNIKKNGNVGDSLVDSLSNKSSDCVFLEGIVQDAIEKNQNNVTTDSCRLFKKASNCERNQLKMIIQMGLSHCKDTKLSEQAKNRLVYLAVSKGNFSVYFDNNSTGLEKSRSFLNAILNELLAIKKNNSKKCVHLIGHSSSSGLKDKNAKLASGRAKKMYDYLIKESRKQLKEMIQMVIGKSSDESIGLDEARDRRVEFKIVDCK